MEIAILGCGVMGSAFARAFAKQGHHLRLYNRSQEKAEQLAKETGGQFFSQIAEAVKGAEVLLLGVKPYQLETLGQALDGLNKEQIALSILSGSPLATLKKEIEGATVVRTMPNLAITTGSGVTAVAEDSTLSLKSRKIVNELLEPLGEVVWAEEKDLDIITALAGSGPSFACTLIEAFAEAGIAHGLRSERAFELTLAMFEGAISLIRAEDNHPAVIRHKICSPGGTTIAGHRALHQHGVPAGIMAAIEAAYNRARGKIVKVTVVDRLIRHNIALISAPDAAAARKKQALQ